MAFFSIIIPSYNRAHSIKKAIESILNQTFQDFEILVIDDASKDNTEEVVKSIEDKRILYFKNEINQERCISRNIGIEKSCGEYICFLDSDDYHLPEHLQNIYCEIQKFKEPKGFFFTNAWNETADGVRTERNCPEFINFNPFTYFLKYTVNPQRWAVHKSVLKYNLFDSEIIICEDMDVSLRIVAAGIPVFHIKERSTVYVAALDSFTVSDQNKAEKELYYLNKIFNRKELIGKLYKREKNRLLSMCYYHLALKMIQKNNKISFYKNAAKSFFLFPNGYNGNTNKILIVNAIYFIPFLGDIVKKIIRVIKK